MRSDEAPADQDLLKGPEPVALLLWDCGL